MLREELALSLVARVLCLELGHINDASDALAERHRELVISNDVLVSSLGVGGDEADCALLVVVEGVWEADLAGLEASVVGDVTLSSEVEPDGGLAGQLLVVAVCEQVALVCGGLDFLGCFCDVGEQRLGSFQGLGQYVSLIGENVWLFGALT